MLTLRVDRLKTSPTPFQLGRSLNLPASPVSVLSAVAKGRDCLLVIDQMDAVSLASGRNPEFFDCIGALLHQAQAHPNMRILAASRKFDIDNDHRLRDLTREEGIAKEVPVGQLDETIVRSVIDELGLDASVLSPNQIDLLSLPIHLKLLAESASKTLDESLGFRTSTDLYDRFWDYKRTAIRRHVDPTQVPKIVNLMANEMSRHQALFVSASLLDEYEETVAVMVSENILVQDGPRVSFFHEGFFDYIFARWFASTDLDLLSYVLEQEQSLFVRSQVRQVLSHQRDLSNRDFSRNLEAILTNPNVRTHLKTIAISLIGLIEDPTEDEWAVIESLLLSDLSRNLIGALYNSVAWFDFLDCRGDYTRVA